MMRRVLMTTMWPFRRDRAMTSQRNILLFCSVSYIIYYIVMDEKNLWEMGAVSHGMEDTLRAVCTVIDVTQDYLVIS